MEEAEIVGKQGEYWVVDTASGRRYFLHDQQFVGRRRPAAGQKGRIGYVQGMASLVQAFIGDDE